MSEPDGHLAAYDVTAGMAGRALATGGYTWHRSGIWSVLRGDRSAATGRNLFAVNPNGMTVDVNPATGKTKDSLAGAGNVLAVDASQTSALRSRDLGCASGPLRRPPRIRF